MGVAGNGANRAQSTGYLRNIFALVIYIPDPLGKFLDRLRRELMPHYNPHAHVSVLPPRALVSEWQWNLARDEARALTEAFPPFPIEAGTIDIFPETEVIYIELARGAQDLHAIHDVLNTGRMKAEEPFPYHPHITLAQEIEKGRVEELLRVARERWAEYPGPRTFMAERAVFVRNTADDRWLDLAEFSLGAVPVGDR